MPDTSFDKALARLHEAMAKVATGDVSAIKAFHSHAADATGFYGWGGYEEGWNAVAARWDWAGQQMKGGTVNYKNLASNVSGDIGYSVDIETFHVPSEASGPSSRSNRVTHIFRRENGEWRLIHRHANRLEDQVKPG